MKEVVKAIIWLILLVISIISGLYVSSCQTLRLNAPSNTGTFHVSPTYCMPFDISVSKSDSVNLN